MLPRYLQKGDTIAIISTARKVSIEDIYPAVELFKSWGLDVLLAPNLFEADNQFAGTDEERASDLIWAFENIQIKAIICARGGYGSARLLQKFDHQILKANPKWLVGFSDVTVLLSLLHKCQIPSIHGIMPLLFKENDAGNSLQSLKDTLFGRPIAIEIHSNLLNRTGNASGILVGGNLSILNNLIGTEADINTKGKILFLEDLDEYLYHIDRMMLHLKLAGKLKDIAGLILGHFSDMKDNTIPFGKTAYQIIADAVSEYNFPICYGFPVGHQFDNMALKVGIMAHLSVDEPKVIFTQ